MIDDLRINAHLFLVGNPDHAEGSFKQATDVLCFFFFRIGTSLVFHLLFYAFRIRSFGICKRSESFSVRDEDGIVCNSYTRWVPAGGNKSFAHTVSRSAYIENSE